MRGEGGVGGRREFGGRVGVGVGVDEEGEGELFRFVSFRLDRLCLLNYCIYER